MTFPARADAAPMHATPGREPDRRGVKNDFKYALKTSSAHPLDAL